jgi:suppressor of fused-like protein
LDKKEGGLIQHMLLAEDPKLMSLETPLGTVNFVQIVGATSEELKASQQWHGPGVLNLLKQHTQTGGPFLVTNMRREESVFEIDASAQDRVREGVAKEGSNLTGVTGLCAWEDPDDFAGTWLKDTQQSTEEPTVPGHRADFPLLEGEVQSLLRERMFEDMHIQLNLESGSLLPLALRGRLLHGRHFTFKQSTGDVAITLVSEGVDGSYASKEHPYVAKGFWLHVYLEPAVVVNMVKDIEVLEKAEKPPLPAVFQWPQVKLKITILPE